MKLVFKVLFSNRKQIILSIIGFVIILTSLLLLVNIRQCVGTTIETNIKNNINNRDIYIDLGLQGDEKVFKEIPSSNKIEKVYKQLPSIDIVSDNEFNNILIGTIEERYPKLIKNIIKDVNENYVIIPTTYSKNSEELLGKEITLKIKENLFYTAIVAGIYESNDNVSMIYTPISYYQNFVISNKIVDDSNIFHIVVKKYEYVQDVISDLKVKNIEAIQNDSNRLEIKMYENLDSSIQKFIIIVTIFLVVMFSLSINLLITKERKFIAIAKALGYKDYKINWILFLVTLIQLLISYIISMILTIIFILIVKAIKFEFFNYLTFSIHSLLIITIIVILLLIFNIFLFSLITKHISIIKFLNQNQ